MTLIVSIYRSPKKEGTYLYVEKAKGLERVPEPLLKQFGKPELAMTLALTSERKLARVDAAKVMDAVVEQGFFLQLPPVPQAGKPSDVA
ncbi:MAG: hypothetical protein CMN85_12540 [Spongiibacteraceae bacterium]|nr:hypothetical protein [Spongiibacteraceae bacterium]|tara:strand:+ start:1826 stop:2092 length:267 start_codon:yes stop_codon:yes gene_type:complete